MTAEIDTGTGRSSWLFLTGGLVFLGGLLLVVYDLVNGNDIARGLVVNAAGAALVIGLAGWETMHNPESSIDTRVEALRAVVFFYAVYLLLGGVVLLVLGFVLHPDPRIGAGALATGLLLAALVFLTGKRGPDRLSTLIGFVGVVLFLASIGLFLYDLWTGHDVLRGIALNAVGAALFVLWSAYDMPSDPGSGVESFEDAAGVALLFYGIYLLLSGGVIVLTAFLDHAYGGLGLWYLGLGLVTAVLGLALAPQGSLDVTSRETTDE